MLLEESNGVAPRDDHLRDKSDLMFQVDRLTQELSDCKLRLLEKNVQKRTEDATRTALFSSYRMESREGRLRFSGKPRIFAEILLIVGRLEKADFDSLREQRAAMEDLIIYVNASVDNIWRLRP